MVVFARAFLFEVALELSECFQQLSNVTAANNKITYERFTCHFCGISFCLRCVRLNPRVWKSDANVVSGGMSFDIFKPGILLLNETKMECNLGGGVAIGAL